jgi:L-rhamnose mutarotase
MMTSLLLDSENLDEYRRRHDNLWPELRADMSERGASNISIFFDEQTQRAYMYVEVADSARWIEGGVSDVTARWWKFMSDIMPTNPDGSPLLHELAELFHQD